MFKTLNGLLDFSSVCFIRQLLSMRSKISFRHAILVIFIVGVLSGTCNGGEEIETAPMKKTEQEALYTAIQGFVGKDWNGPYLYPDPCGWSPMQGVSCDLYNGFWYITGLNIGPIHDNSLDCSSNVEFRPQLFELTHLKTLSFFNCFQNPVSIPSENWEKLACTLESLEFRSNIGLTGQIPTSFSTLTKLQSLVLSGNGLNGALPTNLGYLTGLRRLVLSGNSLTGQIPKSLGGLKELLILDMSRNSLHGTLPSDIGGLASLIKLDLSNNLLSGTLPREIGKLRSLTLLDLKNNKFSGGLINSVEKMVSLEELVLSDNAIGGDLKGIKWKKMRNLVYLDLSNTGLTGNIPDSMSGLKKVRFLGLNDNNLTGNISPKLAALPCISALYIHGNNLMGELKFSAWFYVKMESRFGAWGNPDLCYPVEIMQANHVPVGVKPCHQKVTLLSDSNT